MRARDLNQLGIPNGPAMGEAFRAIEQARAAGLPVVQVELWETPTCKATYRP